MVTDNTEKVQSGLLSFYGKTLYSDQLMTYIRTDLCTKSVGVNLCRSTAELSSQLQDNKKQCPYMSQSCPFICFLSYFTAKNKFCNIAN